MPNAAISYLFSKWKKWLWIPAVPLVQKLFEHHILSWADERLLKEHMKPLEENLAFAVKGFAEWSIKHPVELFVAFGVAYVLCVIVHAQISQAKAQPVDLKVVNPADDDMVSLWQMVYGSVHPPSKPLQVLVYSNDGYWHLQGAPKISKASWEVKCKFGDKEDGVRRTYDIVAVSGKPIKEKKLKELPKGINKSEIVRVFRK